MEFNSDELIVPDWMDNHFFEKVLRHSEQNENIAVAAFKALPATKPGDHFASVIFRIRVTYSTHIEGDTTEAALIVKCAPFATSIKREFLMNTDMFDTEIKMYSETLIEIEKLLKLSGETFTLAPRMLYHTREPLRVLVFEDFSMKGYSMLERQMDLNTATMLFERLGKYHACSYYMNNDKVRQYNTSLFSGPNILTDKLFQENFNNFVAEIETWPGYEMYHQKLLMMKDNILNVGYGIYTSSEGGGSYNVLIHGDLNYKNVLVTKKNGIVDDFVLLDYQISFWASPALDILFALYMMVESSVRLLYRSELIFKYHREFLSTLKKLGYIGHIPSLLDLNQELLKKGKLEIIECICMLPIFFVDFKKLKIDMEEYFTSDHTVTKRTLFQNPDLVSIIKAELPRFLHQGFLN